MRIIGVIAEYNPFHNGHAYQLQMIREKFHADKIIVVMSGYFVQRGAPALIDPYERTKMALSSGADLVLLLPTVYATASAEGFAVGSVALLDALSCVDSLVFGAENDDLDTFLLLAELCISKQDSMNQVLSQKVKEGLSYPTARAKAILSVLQESFQEPLSQMDDPATYIEELLSKPNNILALEYCKALISLKSRIQPIILKRSVDNYTNNSLTGRHSSATSIRKMLEPLSLSNARTDAVCFQMLQQNLASVMPKTAVSVLLHNIEENRLVYSDDFSLLLHDRLLFLKSSELSAYLDVSEALNRRFINHLSAYTGFSDFCMQNKTREFTYTRISRALLHILLDIKKIDCPYQNRQPLLYVRPLGFQHDATGILSLIKKKSSLPIISKLADYENTVRKFYDEERLTGLLPDSPSLFQAYTLSGADNIASFASKQISNTLAVIEKDINCAHLYEMVLSFKNHLPIKNEMQRQVIRNTD